MQRLPPASFSSRHGGWLAVFAIAAALRLTYLLGGPLPFETRQTPIRGDAARHAACGVSLAGGSVGAVRFLPVRLTARPWSREQTGQWLRERGPGYPLFLAALFRLVAVDPWVVRWVQALLGAAVCALVALAGQELASRRVGIVAGGLAALHPSLILSTGRLMTETLALFLLWLGFLLLVRALRLHSLGGLVAAGLAISLGALTRPTLLVLIPFLWIGAGLAAAAVATPRRIAMLAAFTAALVVPLLGWNAASQAIFAGPATAGSFGLRVAAHLFLSATSSDLRGWRADTTPFAPEAELRFDEPAYRAVALLNLVFYHVWFLDNLWREIPTWMHGLQRIVFVLALGGFGLAVLRGRSFAPLLALTLSYVAVSAKYIEIRPVVPWIPVQLLLAGVLVDGCWTSIAARPRPGRTLARAACGAAVAIALVCIRQPSELAVFLPRADPVALGQVGDLIGCIASLLAGGLLYGLVRGALGRRRAALAGLLPTLAFLALFAAYAFVGSGPRWRAFELDLARLGDAAVTRIVLREPLDGTRLRAAYWFADLRSEQDPPRVRVGIDGIWLPPRRSAWRRLACDFDDRFEESPLEGNACFWYTDGLSGFTGAFPRAPQWWSVQVPPALVAGRREVSLRLAVPPRAADGGQVMIGGALDGEPPDRFYGPVLRAAGTLPATSLYRWHVEEDWRLWATQPLASERTECELPFPSEAASGRAARLQRLVAAAAAQRRAHLNVRLLVEYDDGRRVLY